MPEARAYSDNVPQAGRDARTRMFREQYSDQYERIFSALSDASTGMVQFRMVLLGRGESPIKSNPSKSQVESNEDPGMLEYVELRNNQIYARLAELVEEITDLRSRIA